MNAYIVVCLSLLLMMITALVLLLLMEALYFPYCL